MARIDKNSGAAAARNWGARLASGEVVAFLDSDDVLQPRALELHLEAYEAHPSTLATWCEVATIRDRTLVGRSPFVGESPGLRDLAYRNFIHATSAVTVHRRTFNWMGGFREDLTVVEDLEFYFRLFRRFTGRIVHIPAFLVHREIVGDNLTLQLREWASNLANVTVELKANPQYGDVRQELMAGMRRRLHRLMQRATEPGDASHIEAVLKQLSLGQAGPAEVGAREISDASTTLRTPYGIVWLKSDNLDLSTVPFSCPPCLGLADRVRGSRLAFYGLVTSTSVQSDDRIALSLLDQQLSRRLPRIYAPDEEAVSGLVQGATLLLGVD